MSPELKPFIHVVITFYSAFRLFHIVSTWHEADAPVVPLLGNKNDKAINGVLYVALKMIDRPF